MDNILNIISTAAVSGIMAIGVTFVLIVGGIDLSIASTVTLTTVVLGVFLVDVPLDWWMAALLALSTGALVGFVNGLIIARTRVSPIIITLGMASVVLSIATYITQDRPTSLIAFKEIIFIGSGRARDLDTGSGGASHRPYAGRAVPASARTGFGSYVRALGSNREAARLMGLAVGRHQIAVYVLSGVSRQYRRLDRCRPPDDGIVPDRARARTSRDRGRSHRRNGAYGR